MVKTEGSGICHLQSLNCRGEWAANKAPTPVSNLPTVVHNLRPLIATRNCPQQRGSDSAMVTCVIDKAESMTTCGGCSAYLKTMESRAFTLLDICHTYFLLYCHYICEVLPSIPAARLLLAEDAWAESHVVLYCSAARSYSTLALAFKVPGYLTFVYNCLPDLQDPQPLSGSFLHREPLSSSFCSPHLLSKTTSFWEHFFLATASLFWRP